MKKVILSAIIGALFGGAVVFATTKTPISQQNQMVANAKGQPETVQQTLVVENQPVENKQIDDKMDSNIYNSHYSNYLTLCLDNGNGSTANVAGCYDNTRQLAENELENLFYATAKEDEVEKVEEKLNQWKEEREKKCEDYIQISLSTCLADFTVAKISEIYQQN